MPLTTAAINRLTQLGVAPAFHAAIAARRAPRLHGLVYLAIVLVAIAASVAALVGWSRYVAAEAHVAAVGAHARLYNSDIGAGSLGLLLTTLLAAGWLCGTITWRRGSENARNGWAADLLHEPARHKAVTNWLWRQMVRRHTDGAVSPDDFLDRLGGGMVRDLRRASMVMIVMTAGLTVAVPARISFATPTVLSQRPLLPFAEHSVWPVTSAIAIISGCPDLPKTGVTLIYTLRFADGWEANLGGWQPLGGNRLDSLEAVATQLAPAIMSERFSNPINSKPLTRECLRA
jgi:hypothetical protein